MLQQLLLLRLFADDILQVGVLAMAIRTVVVVVVDTTPAVPCQRQRPAQFPVAVVVVVGPRADVVLDIEASEWGCFLPVPAGDDERIVSCLARNFRTDP